MLRYGLAGVVLVFVGLKMVWLDRWFGGKFPIGWSLGIIAGRDRGGGRPVPPLPEEGSGGEVDAGDATKMQKEPVLKEITPKSQDYSQWYLDVVLKADLADYGPVRGCMVIKPYGYAMWENMQRGWTAASRRRGTSTPTPALHPQELPRARRRSTWRGLARVRLGDHGGGEELEERLAMRPTSEAIIGSMYAKWVRSWRDLPILINQWANVVRWEKVTRLFLRTPEFLWQEGTPSTGPWRRPRRRPCGCWRCTATSATTPGHGRRLGKKPDSEKFAGAVHAFAVEALMATARPSRPAPSTTWASTSRLAYGIEYLDRDPQRATPWPPRGGPPRLVGGIVV